MTTVAWDGECLVGDRQGNVGGTPVRCRKVYRVVAPNGRIALFGCSGAIAVAQAFLHWFSGGEKPTFTHDKLSWTVLMIDDRRVVYLRSSACDYWDSLGRIKWAIGSGVDYALGAMAAGKSALEAVRIAGKLDVDTGMGRDILRFPNRSRRMDGKR